MGAHTLLRQRSDLGDPVLLGLKTVGNGRENTVIIPAPALYDRERWRERESRTGKRIRYYGISGTEYFDRERVDYDRESITQNGNIDIHVTT
jgi:hypothetical protein